MDDKFLLGNDGIIYYFGLNNVLAGVLSGPAATAVLDLLVAIFYLLLLLQYNVTLTLIGIAFSSVGIIMFFAMRRKSIDLSMRIQQDSGKAYGVVMNGLRMIETIKANGDEADFFTKWSGYQTKVLKASQDMALWSMSVNLLPTLLGGINGALVGLGSTLQSTEMQMQRLNDVRRYEVDSLNFPADDAQRTYDDDRLSGELIIEDVNFGYSPLEKPLLSHFSMYLRPGGWVAVVGASGSGKSTLTKIVTGLYQEWSGVIAFDGVDRRKLPRTVILNSLSAVDQDIFLITGTVAENIALFDKSILGSDIVQAAKDACIHDDIMKLDGGYDAQVAEGGLNYRLSTIRDCDEIIVLHRGQVVERGTHREMIQHDGPYKKLIEEREQEQ